LGRRTAEKWTEESEASSVQSDWDDGGRRWRATGHLGVVEFWFVDYSKWTSARGFLRLVHFWGSQGIADLLAGILGAS